MILSSYSVRVPDSRLSNDIYKLTGIPEEASLGEVKMYARGFVKRNLPSLVADVTNSHFAENMRTFSMLKDPEKLNAWKQEQKRATAQTSMGRRARFIVPLDGNLPILEDTLRQRHDANTVDPQLSGVINDIAKSVLAAEPEFVVRYAQSVVTYNSIERNRTRDDFLGVDEFGSDLHSRAVADLILTRACTQLIEGTRQGGEISLRIESHAEFAEQMAVRDAPALSVAGDDGIGRRISV